MLGTWKNRWRHPGGGAEVMRIAWPLILSNSFWTIQIILDRMFLSRHNPNEGSAALAAALLVWTPLTLLQFTASYSATFVAQYVGAGRPERAGPSVWQAIHFAVAGGLAFLLLLPLAGPLVGLTGHSAELRQLEVGYFRCLCFMALPMLVVGAVSGFFTGLGKSRTVLLINFTGVLVNAPLTYAWVFGKWGLPEWGVVGAGWATFCGVSVSAILSVALLLRREFRQAYQTLAGWRFERPLFARLMRFGIPNGLMTSVETLAFTLFVLLIGRLGEAQFAASNVALTLNLIAYFPAMGIAQAVGVLVGQRLGEDDPALAERTTYTGLRLALGYTAAVVLLYLLIPGPLVALFRTAEGEESWQWVAATAPLLLRFVALYALFDATTLMFSFALRGAGDTRFVSMVTLVASWTVMVVPTWLAWRQGWGLLWAWGFGSAYIATLATVLVFRFRQGKWKAMRVIEVPAVEVPEEDAVEAEVEPSRCA